MIADAPNAGSRHARAAVASYCLDWVPAIRSPRKRGGHMHLRQIEYFVALYDERSITKAARRLNVVQPALSMQISRLEKTFKAKLFERTSRGVVPTDIGRKFYSYCQKILGDVEEAERYLRDSSGVIGGRLTVGVMPSVANSVLPEVIAEYKANFPDVKLIIVESYSGSLLDQLYAGSLDLAVVNRTNFTDRTALVPLFRDYLVLVTRRTASKKRVPSEIPSTRLSDYKLVLPSQRQGMRQLVDSIMASNGMTLVPEIEIDSLGPTLDLVREGDWATILPIVAVKREVDRKELRSQCIVDPQIPRDVVVATPATRPPSLAAELFLKILKAKINALLGDDGHSQ